MIHQTFYYLQDGTDPFENLALEQHLMETVPDGGCILYLWQNRHTVVIGKNQNAWKECRVQQLADDGGRLARRLSGGGAVYHDLGNLNFTFLIHKADYDISRQLDVILKALELLGIQAEKSGRNDLHADGRKFSGNAFYETGDRCYHHGTLMVQVDREQLGKYLQVSASKLKSKGVASVQARVVNLTELKPGLTISQLKQALIDAMGLVYGAKATVWPKQPSTAIRWRCTGSIMHRTNFVLDEISRLHGNWSTGFRGVRFSCSARPTAEKSDSCRCILMLWMPLWHNG